MTVYVVRDETVCAFTKAPALLSSGDVLINSAEELQASTLSRAELVAIWNGLPGTTEVTRFKDRKTAVRRIWAAFQELPVKSEPVPAGPGPRTGSKQAEVIRLLQRHEGATVSEIMNATGWQAHTVRGMFAGALRKKLGLTLASLKEERGRVYRVVDAAA